MAAVTFSSSSTPRVERSINEMAAARLVAASATMASARASASDTIDAAAIDAESTRAWQARRRSPSRCCQLRSGLTLRWAVVTAPVSCSSKRYSNGLGRYTSVPEMVISRPASKLW